MLRLRRRAGEDFISQQALQLAASLLFPPTTTLNGEELPVLYLRFINKKEQRAVMAEATACPAFRLGGSRYDQVSRHDLSYLDLTFGLRVREDEQKGSSGGETGSFILLFLAFARDACHFFPLFPVSTFGRSFSNFLFPAETRSSNEFTLCEQSIRE